MAQDLTVTSPVSEKVSYRPMAVSSDVILTTRSQSVTDLSLTNGASSSVAAGPSKPGRDAEERDDGAAADSNVAACYGVDTVHSWASVSAGTGHTILYSSLGPDLQHTLRFIIRLS